MLGKNPVALGWRNDGREPRESFISAGGPNPWARQGLGDTRPLGARRYQDGTATRRSRTSLDLQITSITAV